MIITTAHTAAGSYYPFVQGARTPAEVTPLCIDGRRVLAEVDEYGHYEIFVGGTLVADGDLDGTESPLQTFFAAEAMTATADLDGPVSEAVQDIRSLAVCLRMDANAAAAETLLRLRGREMGENDPRHPAQRAAHLRRDADILAAWTDEDEAAYSQYLSDGLADTDGYYAPMDRAAWKRTA